MGRAGRSGLFIASQAVGHCTASGVTGDALTREVKAAVGVTVSRLIQPAGVQEISASLYAQSGQTTKICRITPLVSRRCRRAGEAYFIR